MKNSTPFSRALQMMAVISAAISAGNTGLVGINTAYHSRGKGLGLPGNKKAKSSFKQNKRRGL